MRKGFDIDLRGMNTFRMKVSCRCLVEYDSVHELREILSDESLPRPFFPIGGGSNLLFTGDFPGTLLHCNMKEILRRDDGRVHADAGVVWDDFCSWCADNGLWGPENLSYIPGEVGAAAVQNIGAYGKEAGDIIDSVTCVDAASGELVEIPASLCRYSYRESRFKQDWKGRYIVVGVTFRLSEAPAPELDYGHVRQAVKARFGTDDPEKLSPRMIRETVTEVRRTKLPEVSDLGSAGSFFRNPYVGPGTFERIKEIAQAESLGPVPFYPAGERDVKIPAAWMIEKCGWKGRTVGGAAVYMKQPLVIVNQSGEATPEDVMSLEREIVLSVERKFGVRLEKEVEYV